MAKIYKLVSTLEAPPKTFSLQSANHILPLVIKYTEEALRTTENVALKMQNYSKTSKSFKILCEKYDEAIQKWVERVHRVGGIAKELWLVDFDTGDGCLCWTYPEKRVEHYHSYEGGFKSRTKVV